MGLLSFLLLFTVVREAFILMMRTGSFITGIWNGAGLLGSLTAAAAGWVSGPARVPHWLVDGRGSLLIFFFAVGALAIGFREARRIPSVTKVDVSIDGLPPSLHGLTIVQISDLHVGSTIQRPFVQKVVDAANALDADLIALTGDLIDGTVKQLEPHFSPIGELSARLGVFYVTGNHEYYWEADAWIEHIRKLGITPLLDSHAVITKGGTPIVIAGVVDLWAGRSTTGPRASDPRAALHGAPAEAGLRILLAHQPKTVLEASTLGYDLQLSGHTHGGQFLPWTVAVRWFQPFTRGLHRVGRMWLYVNRGTGYWGPPVRLGSASEITLIRILRA